MVSFAGVDAVGRERSLREFIDGATNGPKTNVSYNALGQLSNAVQSEGATTLFNRHFDYDALGNVTGLNDLLGSAGAAVSYGAIDRDRMCRIGYGPNGLGGTACNVQHDAVGNVVDYPTRTGARQLSYFGSGQVRTVTDAGAHARFRYDAFGQLQSLDVDGPGATEPRRDRHHGPLLEQQTIASGATRTSLLTRHIPAAEGVVITRRGAGNQWVFEFGELRGNRFFTDQDGKFIQDLGYQPYGEARASGAAVGSIDYSSHQWNGGDTLATFGLSQLGARLYDPVIGRFLSRDPLLIPRTASTTNPYAFAMNDPINGADPSGLDCDGEQCKSDTPLLPLAPLFWVFDSLFGGGGPAPAPAPAVSNTYRDAQAAKAAYDELRYQAEQARICGKDPNSNFCDGKPPVGNILVTSLLSPFYSLAGVPSYYVRTEVSRAGLLRAKTGVEYFAARDQYNAKKANVSLGRINEETARYAGVALSPVRCCSWVQAAVASARPAAAHGSHRTADRTSSAARAATTTASAISKAPKRRRMGRNWCSANTPAMSTTWRARQAPRQSTCPRAGPRPTTPATSVASSTAAAGSV